MREVLFYFMVAPSSLHMAPARAPGPLSFFQSLSFKSCCLEPWCQQDADRVKSPDKALKSASHDTVGTGVLGLLSLSYSTPQ